jgi:hypothetical protein
VNRCAGPVRISLALVRRALLLGIFLVLTIATGAAAASAWQAPLRPLTVTRHFEPPPTVYAAGHRGVDLAGRPGEPVKAAGPGVISYAGPLAGRGVVVVVHGALRTTYEPVSATVRRGDAVSGGQQIGTLQTGHPGCPVPACLHWGLLRGDVYLDPLSLLGERRIRLLPPNGELQVRPAAQLVRLEALVHVAGSPSVALSPSVSWSVAALAGAGVVMVRRRR